MTQARAYHHGQLRRALVEAAQQVLAERGADGLSLRECARRVGVSHAAPKHHFADKTALLTAVAAAGYRALAAEMDRRQTAAGVEPRAQLRAVGLGYVAFALERPSLFRLMFGETALDTGDGELTAAADAAFARLDRALAAVEAAEAAAPADPAARRLTAWSAVHGFATLWLAGHLQRTLGIADAQDGALAAADRLLAALRP
jgi:AcrR family transcriptional regulator